MYYAMKNCEGDAEKLRSYIVNMVDHYKVCTCMLICNNLVKFS